MGARTVPEKNNTTENTCLLHCVLMPNTNDCVRVSVGMSRLFLLNYRLNCRFVVYLFPSLLLPRGITGRQLWIWMESQTSLQ